MIIILRKLVTLLVRPTTADDDLPVTSLAASVRNPAHLASGKMITARLEVHVYAEVPSAATPRRAGVLKITAENNSRKLAEVNHLSPLDRERRPVFVARDEGGDRIRD